MIGDYSVTDQSIDNIYQNGLLTRPTTTHSMYRSAQGGFITGYKFMDDIYKKYNGLPEDNQLKDTLSMIEREKSVEGIGLGQNILNWTADVVGYSLSPPVLALGGIAGAGVRAAGIGARAVAPKAVVSFLDRQVGKFTVGQIGERLATGAAIGEFTAIPLAFEEGSANVAHAMGGLGLAIGAVPILWGLRKGLKSKVSGDVVAAEGGTKPLSEMDQWYHDLETKAVPMEELQARATKILQNEGFEMNPVTHQAEFKILEPKDVKNIQNAVADSIVSDVSQANKNNVIDYMLNNKIDQIRGNPKARQMLDSYDSYIGEKIGLREKITAHADKVHLSNMENKLLNNSFLSQPEIHKAIKNLPKEERHPSQLPFTLPENLEKKMNLERRIAELKKRPPTKKNNLRIEELQSKIPQVLSPKEELADIAHKLLDKKQYRNPLGSRSYQRLLELEEHWPQAKSLMDRVRLEEQFEKQKSLKESLEKIKKEVDQPIQNSANIDNVITYLKERIEGMRAVKTPPGVKIKSPEQKIADAGKVPTDLETTLAEQAEFVEQLSEKAPELKKEFTEIHNKIRQFKKSDKVLKDYINCVLGAI